MIFPIRERTLTINLCCFIFPIYIAEMHLNHCDVWAHLAPMFHLVDVFAVYAITMVGGRHVVLPTFSASEALLLMGKIAYFGSMYTISFGCFYHIIS